MENFRAEIERARKLDGTIKMTESLRLFDEVCSRMLAGIKAEHPGISDETARQIRRQRIDTIRKIESLP
jgi:hypothetical protein